MIYGAYLIFGSNLDQDWLENVYRQYGSIDRLLADKLGGIPMPDKLADNNQLKDYREKVQAFVDDCAYNHLEIVQYGKKGSCGQRAVLGLADTFYSAFTDEPSVIVEKSDLTATKHGAEAIKTFFELFEINGYKPPSWKMMATCMEDRS